MGHKIQTFSNIKGGNIFYKAISHPAVKEKASKLIRQLEKEVPSALYDPLGLYSSFSEFYNTSAVKFVATFVQDIERIGSLLANQSAEPVTELQNSGAKTIFIAAFDVEPLRHHINHLIPHGANIISFDDMRVDENWLTNKSTYLSKENFATNYAFFREESGMSTRLTTANYWSNYGATNVKLHLILFDQAGKNIAQWSEKIEGAGMSISIDSAKVRERFNLPEFTGQLFVQFSGVQGHDVVKYALDIFCKNQKFLTCTHDSNAWPSDFYAGLPAPRKGETVILWIQNSHPCSIPSGEIGINVMGTAEICRVKTEVPPFGTYSLSIGDLLPNAMWPQQIEIQAGKHFVRPRYEITGGPTVRRIAHVNVERADLKPDPKIRELTHLVGKGFILPAPILPARVWRSTLLPTPMSTAQNKLPIAALIFDPNGNKIATHKFGLLPRSHKEILETSNFLTNERYGHVELIYDFTYGTDVDGWLHGLFRYENKETCHTAETSFGAHIFNTILTFKNEPQSYSSRPPGLSTRLFLRVDITGIDTFLHLLYPASSPWHDDSNTSLSLINPNGKKIVEVKLSIPCGGSRLRRISELFKDKDLDRAGAGSYIIVRDTSCRLFGYHGLISEEGPFSLDHMFGF